MLHPATADPPPYPAQLPPTPPARRGWNSVLCRGRVDGIEIGLSSGTRGPVSFQSPHNLDLCPIAQCEGATRLVVGEEIPGWENTVDDVLVEVTR
jgi:hypothetical protein